MLAVVNLYYLDEKNRIQTMLMINRQFSQSWNAFSGAVNVHGRLCYFLY